VSETFYLKLAWIAAQNYTVLKRNVWMSGTACSDAPSLWRKDVWQHSTFHPRRNKLIFQKCPLYSQFIFSSIILRPQYQQDSRETSEWRFGFFVPLFHCRVCQKFHSERGGPTCKL